MPEDNQPVPQWRVVKLVHEVSSDEDVRTTVTAEDANDEDDTCVYRLAKSIHVLSLAERAELINMASTCLHAGQLLARASSIIARREESLLRGSQLYPEGDET